MLVLAIVAAVAHPLAMLRQVRGNRYPALHRAPDTSRVELMLDRAGVALWLRRLEMRSQVVVFVSLVAAAYDRFISIVKRRQDQLPSLLGELFIQPTAGTDPESNMR